MTDEKPVERADRIASEREPAADLALRRWWRLLPLVLTSPTRVFRALREDDEDDVAARQEPILLIVLLAGMAGAVITPTWGTLLDDSSVDGLVVAVLTFIGGGAAGAVVYAILGVSLWIGIRGAGSLEPTRLVRQVAAFSALPIALSILVTLPIGLIAFGSDYFRSGGSDDGTGRDVVLGIGLAFVAWSVVLLGLGLRVTLRLPWRGVAVAMALATVTVGLVATLPYVL